MSLPLRSPHPALRSATAVLGCLGLLTGCGTTVPSVSLSPTPSPTAAATPSSTASPTAPPDPATVYAAIEEQVRAIRGLEPTTEVDPKVVDETELKTFLTNSFQKDNPANLVAANDRLLKALGLLDQGASLEDLYLRLLGSQVAGAYNPDDKTLYVLSKTGGLGPTEETTFAHEYTHALQDQNFNLTEFQLDTIGEGDRAIAHLALVEGDATLVMSLWQLANLSQSEILRLLGESLDPSATAVLQDMPPVMVKSLLFPYTSGLSFTQGLQGSGGWEAVDAAFAKPPTSTEQIIHPEKYEQGEAPVAVDLPDDLAARMGSGWSVALEDRLGEFQLSVWLDEAPGAGAASRSNAAAGWGGDRVAVLEGPNDGWAVVVRTAWDSAADAGEFETAARPIVQALDGSADLLIGAGGTERWVVIAKDAGTLQQLANVLGLAE